MHYARRFVLRHIAETDRSSVPPMAAQAQTPHPEAEEPRSAESSAFVASATGPAEDANAVGVAGVVEVELNFNAFADHVPPTQHARRAANQFDPSIQDFADQALEVAALRAELNRLARERNALQTTVQQRDSLVQRLREKLSLLQVPSQADPLAETTHRLNAEVSQALGLTTTIGTNLKSEVPPRNEVPLKSETRPKAEIHPKNETHADRSVTQEEATSSGDNECAVHRPVEYDAAATVVLPASPLDDERMELDDSSRTARESSTSESTPGRKLLPVDHAGNAIVLSRDVITIGRTRQNDVCIPSCAVSRDHARLLVGAASVTLFDMGSANGCFVNDEPIKRQRLRDGDLVRIGDRSYRFADRA
jgi:hypothetical protein